ncbi:MAG: glycosyl transferase [Chitinophagaceae bacterium]|nr:glycosyl transferase [Chitinophagaceae bacterium]
MKIAHLILAHKNPVQLQKLITALSHPSFDFYIHVDKKVDITLFSDLTSIKNTYIIKKRTNIYWAGYGTIQATINGFEEILQNKYDYINVISAQDFPIKSSQYIYNYIAERQGIEFISCESIEKEWTEAAHRINKYHLINWRIPGKYRLQEIVNHMFPKRKFPLNYIIVGRSNWFTITVNASLYILDFLKKNPAVIKYFKYCWGADEFIFATILYNSGFKDKILNNLVYVDWKGQTKGHPRILGLQDFNELKQSDKLFARTFDMQTNPLIIDKLLEFISNQNQLKS